MKKLLSFLGATFLLVVVGIGGTTVSILLLKEHYALAATNAIESPTALFTTSLASSITSSATSMTLVSALTKDGTNLASSTYSFILDEGTASEEFVIADCTSTSCTNMQRGLSVVTGTTTVSALQKAHRRGASVKQTDAPVLIKLARIINGIASFPNALSYTSAPTIASTSQTLTPASYVYGNYVNTSETQAVNGAKTFSATTTLTSGALTTSAYVCGTGSSNLQICDKAYIDGVAVAGASNANTTTKGIVEQATVAEIDAGTATGGTGAVLFTSPDKLASSKFASTTVSNYATSTTKAYVSVPVVANDIVMVWADADAGGALGVNAGYALTLNFKHSLWAASSTVDTATAGTANGSNAGFGLMSMYRVIATTTESLNFSAEINGGSEAQIMTLKIPAP